MDIGKVDLEEAPLMIKQLNFPKPTPRPTFPTGCSLSKKNEFSVLPSEYLLLFVLLLRRLISFAPSLPHSFGCRCLCLVVDPLRSPPLCGDDDAPLEKSDPRE